MNKGKTEIFENIPELPSPPLLVSVGAEPALVVSANTRYCVAVVPQPHEVNLRESTESVSRTNVIQEGDAPELLRS